MDAAFAFSATSNSPTKQSAVTNQEATISQQKKQFQAIATQQHKEIEALPRLS